MGRRGKNGGKILLGTTTWEKKKKEKHHPENQKLNRRFAFAKWGKHKSRPWKENGQERETHIALDERELKKIASSAGGKKGGKDGQKGRRASNGTGGEGSTKLKREGELPRRKSAKERGGGDAGG